MFPETPLRLGNLEDIHPWMSLSLSLARSRCFLLSRQRDRQRERERERERERCNDAGSYGRGDVW